MSSARTGARHIRAEAEGVESVTVEKTEGTSIVRRYREDGAGLFSKVHSNSTKGNRYKLEHEEFQ